ncbi:hypothetical protein Tco_1066925 [Tanacetum coccineum]|uniref:Reverse transcriptase n=1 Tax=Tanacetum coccineum TaxID=301880 RepID=A0ABQ5HDL0_9ASTR
MKFGVLFALELLRWIGVMWYGSLVLFPSHVFHLWLVIRRHLKTQDNLRPWDAAGLNTMVWHHLKGLAGLPNASDSIDAIINDIKPFAARRTSRSIIAKLVVAATTYFIWQERNGRLFKNSKRTVSQVIECIMNSVRLKLMSCRLKKTSSALVMAKDWNISESTLSYALFQPYRISDHSPAVLNIPNLPFNKPKPFKIFNFLAHKSQFRELLSSVWSVNVDGHKMYQVVSKLKALKKPFRKLLHDQGNLHDRVNKLRFELDEVQKALDLNPNDLSLREDEAVYVQAFSEAKLDEERFLKQKAKIEWLEVGDSNSAYFHKSVKSRIHRSRIDVIMNSDNIEVTGSNVADVFVSHYKMFLGSDMVCDNLNMDGLFLKKVSADSFSIHMVFVRY